MGIIRKISAYAIWGVTSPIWFPIGVAASIRSAYNERDTVYSGNVWPDNFARRYYIDISEKI